MDTTRTFPIQFSQKLVPTATDLDSAGVFAPGSTNSYDSNLDQGFISWTSRTTGKTAQGRNVHLGMACVVAPVWLVTSGAPGSSLIVIKE